MDASDSQDVDGAAPVQYLWDFGDGTPVISTKKASIQHSFDAPGSYPVSCTVVDKDGLKASASFVHLAPS